LKTPHSAWRRLSGALVWFSKVEMSAVAVDMVIPGQQWIEA